jgi:hypothetical protein
VAFAPSIDNARKEGVRVLRGEYPAGVAGVKLSLEAIAQHIREGANDKDVQGVAMDALLAAGVDGRTHGTSARAKMDVLLAYVRKNTVYTQDPPGTELVKSAAAMLCLRPGLCIRGGDCFPEGTLLSVGSANGSPMGTAPIEKIQVGAIIWGKDAWTRVLNVWSKGPLSVHEIRLSNGSTMRLTGNHHIYRLGSSPSFDRVRVDELRAYDILLQPNGFEVCDLALRKRQGRGKNLVVTSISKDVETVPCWDISTSDHYVYLPEHDVTVSNCDDMCILLGSMLLSVGVPVMVVKQRWGLTDQEHVLIEAQDDNGRWIPLDPSTNVPSGSKTPSSDEFRLDPSNPSMIGLTGAPEAQFVSIGATPGFPIRSMGVFRMSGLSPRTVGLSTPTATAPTSTSNPYGQALIDLQNMVQTPIGIADSYLKSGDYASALTAYQAAGQAGATTVGPEIDLVGAPAYTQPLTKQAWITNGTLAAISPANQANATLAQSMVKEMLASYVAAIQAGQTAFNGGNPGSVPTPSWSVTAVVPWMLGTGLVAGLGFAYLDAQSRRQRPIPLRRRKRGRR